MGFRRFRCHLIGIVLTLATPAKAEEACVDGPVRREHVVTCSVRASASIKMDREGVAAAAGRRTATAPWFPANPTLSLSVARRAGTEGRSAHLNYSATLAQELEIAGSRSSQRRAAEAELQARREDLAAETRRAAAEGLWGYFDVLASREALAVALRLETNARQIAVVTKGRADAGVISQLDAEVAEVQALRIAQARLDAERDLRARSSRLAMLLGRDPLKPIVVEGELVPLPRSDSLADGARAEMAKRRPEVRAFDRERDAADARAEAYRRARVPSVTLQVFAQNDGYNERVFGGGLSVPITLPQPVGHSYAGQIRESEALARQATAAGERVTREISVDIATSVADYESHKKEAALFTPERLARAEHLLSEIGKEIESGRLAVRDALLAQRELIDVVRGYVEARRALCLASVSLAFAAGEPLQGDR